MGAADLARLVSIQVGLDEASVCLGDVYAFELLDRPSPEWSVARATQALRRRTTNPAAAVVPSLSAAWRTTLSH